MGAHLSEAGTGMLEKDAAQSCPGDRRGMTDCTAEFVGVSLPPVTAAPGMLSCCGRWVIGLVAWTPPSVLPASPRAACSVQQRLHLRDLGSSCDRGRVGLARRSARGQWKARCLKSMMVTKAMPCQVPKGHPVLNQLA